MCGLYRVLKYEYNMNTNTNMSQEQGCMDLLVSMQKTIDTMYVQLNTVNTQLNTVLQQNADIKELIVKKYMDKRRTSSKRGLSCSDTTLLLKTVTPPSMSFFEWVLQIQKREDIYDFVKNTDKIEVAIFTALRTHYRTDDSPVFSVKREKSNFIFENGVFRLMHENDMKRIIIGFQCRAMILLEQSRANDSDADSDSADTVRHFQEKYYTAESEKINKLVVTDPRTVRTLLRKFNTYMLNARGIMF